MKALRGGLCFLEEEDDPVRVCVNLTLNKEVWAKGVVQDVLLMGEKNPYLNVSMMCAKN